MNTTNARRIALALSATAVLATAPADATPLITLPVTSTLFPLHVDKTVNVGTLDVFGGPAGPFSVPVGVRAKVSVDLKALNPLLVTADVKPCAGGAPGVLVDVHTIGSTVDGAVTVDTNTVAGRVVAPISVGAVETKTVGVCLSGTGVGKRRR